MSRAHARRTASSTRRFVWIGAFGAGLASFTMPIAVPTVAIAAAPAELTVSLAATPAVVEPGGTYHWTVTVANTGDSATGAPVRVQWVGTSGDGATGTGWTCTNYRRLRTRTTPGACVTPAMAAGTSRTITLVSRAAPGTHGTYSLSATVDPKNAVVEIDESNNVGTGTYVVPHDGLSDLVLYASGGPLPSPALPTEPISYSMTVGNVGIFPGVSGITVADTLSPAIVPVSASVTPAGACAIAGQDITCTGLPVGAVIAVVAQPVPTGALVDVIASHTATVDPANALVESNETNNDLTGSTRISNTLPDVTISMTTTPSAVGPNAVFAHTVTVRNDGAANAPAVAVTFPTLAGTWIGGAGPGITCAGPTKAYFRHPAKPARCDLVNLAAGSSATVTIELRAKTIAGTSTTTGAVAVSGARELDTTDNTASANVLVTSAGVPDLTVTATASPASAAPGQTVTFSIVVANAGTGPAGSVTIADTLPAGFTFAGTTGMFGCSAAPGVVTCPTFTLLPGRTVALSILATAPATVGSFVNTLVVDPANTIVESDETNNSAATTVGVTDQLPNLTVSVSGPDTVPLDGNATYLVTVTNDGSGIATSIAAAVSLPGFDSLDDTSATAGFACTERALDADGRIADCTGGSLAPGAQAVIELVVSGAYRAGSTTVFATVDPGAAIQELSETDNTATFVTTVL